MHQVIINERPLNDAGKRKLTKTMSAICLCANRRSRVAK
ncbi:hypothetical protein B4168_4083 [Anoxybacillus flavithermus]|nr:hypothetical protein B4168_4083 [Anoxybacillus flavithermus]OAO84421.1 hypothetical protein GT23_3571 [Parageobacillus thermoglucosidasius]